MKLEKVNKELYATKDAKYVLRKSARIYPPRGIRKVWKLYCDGNYVGCPETIVDANKMIKQHEKYLEEN